MSAILLNINLRGVISGSVKHTEKQIVTVDVSPVGSKHPEFMTKKIRHNDRIETPCCKKIKISEEIVAEWERSECPHWEKPSQWKVMTKLQKIVSNLKRYDEGFGFTFDFVS